MNEDLPDPSPRTSGRLTIEELHGFLGGITPDWYLTRDLYPRYCAWAEREGKSVVSAKILGESIRHVLNPERKRVGGNKAIWRITEKLTRPKTEAELFAEGRAWFVDPTGRATTDISVSTCQFRPDVHPTR